ncbi:MAG: hypothetical protein GY797_35105 [Deltaproteobacteria bacterium]|nr:hypothetical protein [Deltaproteobacteria bacterium]
MEKSNLAMRELDQTIVILSDMNKKFNDSSRVEELTAYDLQHLHNICQRVRNLSIEIFGSADSFDAWVGPIKEVDKKQTEIQVTRIESELTSRLFNFVQGFRHFETIEEEKKRYSEENATLKRQLTELRNRETTYLSILERAKTSPSEESKIQLLKSLRRQEETIVGNLNKLKEIKAKSGMSAPLDVLNGIEQYEVDLEEVLINVTELEKRKT